MSYIENVKTFVRVYELGNMSAAARDQRISPAVASSRVSQLEDHLGVRLFQRTTRNLTPTEQGRLFYTGAQRVLEAIDEAEANVQDITQSPRGSLYVATPLGIGRRWVAPAVPQFKERYPLIDVRLRMSDRKVDLTAEGLDVAFFLGNPEDSTLKMRKFSDCSRLLCASPKYLEKRGVPTSPDQLTDGTHDCLNLRFPGAQEFQWTLQTQSGVKRYAITGPFESDDGDVLTQWALDGHGIILKPYFEVAKHLRDGSLVAVLPDARPTSVQIGCLYPHRRKQDPKTRIFIDFISNIIGAELSSMPTH